MASIIVKHFSSDKYSAIFSPDTGFFARIEDQGTPDPFWAEHGPEMLDVSITNWCDKGCSFCYRKSNRVGKHISVEDYREIMRQAKDMHVFQVALGGGNPNQHPYFCEILRVTRQEFGIVPNYTTNGRGLGDDVLKATKAYCGAVAISAYPPYAEMGAAIELFSSLGVSANIHFVLDRQSVETAIQWLKSPPAFLSRVHAIVFLNYKPVGRHLNQRNLLNQSPYVEEFFRLATQDGFPFRIGFDTCSVTGLARHGSVSCTSLEGCDAGRFSLFVSEQMEVFPCSFMVEAGYQGASLRNMSLIEIWRKHPIFRKIRDKHLNRGCGSCTTSAHCLGGCPLFPEMNLCVERCVEQHLIEKMHEQK
jgi:radical SAM protein with 4Fe4S-binding SPASM domain